MPQGPSTDSRASASHLPWSVTSTQLKARGKENRNSKTDESQKEKESVCNEGGQT